MTIDVRYRGCQILGGDIGGDNTWSVLVFRAGRPYHSARGATAEEAIEEAKRRIDAALGVEPQPELSEEW